MPDLPAVTGFELIKLLAKDGWEVGRKTNHGRCLTKQVGDRTLVTFVPERSRSLAKSTLGQIIGSKQTRIGRKGLLDLIEKHGL